MKIKLYIYIQPPTNECFKGQFEQKYFQSNKNLFVDQNQRISLK